MLLYFVILQTEDAVYSIIISRQVNVCLAAKIKYLDIKFEFLEKVKKPNRIDTDLEITFPVQIGSCHVTVPSLL